MNGKELENAEMADQVEDIENLVEGGRSGRIEELEVDVKEAGDF